MIVRLATRDHCTVFPQGLSGLEYFPDESMCWLNERESCFLMVAEKSTYRIALASDCTPSAVNMVLGPSRTQGFDRDYAGITSLYWRDDREVLGFYHAEDEEHMPQMRSDSTTNASYWSIGLARSYDGGETFQRAGQILRSSQEKDTRIGQHQGIGDVCIIRDDSNRCLYAYYTELQTTQRANATIGMARCVVNDASRLDAWKKWNGNEFMEDGLGGADTPIVEVGNGVDVFQPHVCYVEIGGVRAYVMVYCVLSHDEFNRVKKGTLAVERIEQSGMYFRISKDGITWSDATQLAKGLTVPIHGKPYIGHPTLWIADIASGSGRLLYCYSEKWGRPSEMNIPHYLVARDVSLTRSSEILFL